MTSNAEVSRLGTRTTQIGTYCSTQLCDHHPVASLRIETRGLVLTKVEPEELHDVLAVRMSNPDRLVRTEGHAGDSGGYDLSMLERDVDVALADPARHVLVARTRAEPRVVGYVDVLDEHPEDGYPWLGTVEIHADEQRRSFGQQCVEAIAQRARTDLAARVLRAAADADDARAQAFLTSLKFVSVDTRERSSPQGRKPVIVWERSLLRK
jgi:ribosomal protein S18 acetylase RimI-like enzyme